VTPKKKKAPKPRTKTMYMHTLNGKPAFQGEHQICYAVGYSGGVLEIPRHLASSKATIQRRINKTVEWRKSMGYSVNELEYGYLAVKVQVIP
jgi:hypothetical protein